MMIQGVAAKVALTTSCSFSFVFAERPICFVFEDDIPASPFIVSDPGLEHAGSLSSCVAPRETKGGSTETQSETPVSNGSSTLNVLQLNISVRFKRVFQKTH
jgi:hypothetical protein